MTADRTWRLGHRPELDGLRGVAIALVVLSHLSRPLSHLRFLGLAGVVVFFVLSGFLITSLLLEERERSGSLDLLGFYRRRALRLAPALVACVVVVGVAGAALGSRLGPTYAPPALVLGALTWTSNWVVAGGEHAGTALTHTWSLSIEEQFYLVWPPLLLVLLRRRQRWLVPGLVAGACASAAMRFVLIPEGVDRINNGSDTRADALLVGCLVAVLVHRRAPRPARPVVALLLLVAIVASSLWFPVAAVVLLLPLTTAAATAVVVTSVVGDGGVRWLRGRALTLLGRRSYGWYLWHWPVVVAANRLLDDPGWPLLALVVLPVCAVLVTLSWRYVEQPFLRLRRRPAGVARPVPVTG